MFKNFSLKKTLTPLFITLNIILYSLIVMIFRVHAVKTEKAARVSGTESLAARIDDYFEKKMEVIESISGIEQIIRMSSGDGNNGLDMTVSSFNLIKRTIGASVVYLMNSEGSVVGSSTYRGSETLAGGNYRFRPYFREAISGRNSFYIAAGITTRERGMYFGFPVKGSGMITGVLVIKFGLSQIDRILLDSGLSAGMVSPDGIIFSSSERGLIFGMTEKLTPGKISEIVESKQLGAFSLKELSFDLSSDRFRYRDEDYYVYKKSLKIPGWSIFVYSALDLRLNYFYPTAVFLVMLLFGFLLVNTLRDYRIKKTARDSLMESRERFRYLFESAMDSILFLDGNRRITDLNRVTESLFGYSAEELSGEEFARLFHGDSIKIYEEHFRKVETALKDRFEFHGRRKDGTGVFIDCMILFHRGRDEKTSSYFVTCSDITDRKEAEIVLRNAKEAAEQANTSKSEFLANMSHEIRTPMTAVLGFSELLEATSLNAKQKEYVGIIKTAGESLLYLIDEILDFSKIEAGKVQIAKRNFDLRKLLSRIEKTIRIWIKEKEIDFSINVEDGVPEYLNGDPERLRQIIHNLLNNAVKFTDEGVVTLNISVWKEIRSMITLQFSVSDTGIGISRDDTDKLFKSFSQIDSAFSRQYGGTGLGLAITSKLVEMMGGSMEVESILGKGTRFFFSISFRKASSADNEEEILKSDRKSMSMDLSGYTVLVVEDNSVNRMLLDYTLKKEGFKVETVSNGEEALELLKNRSFDIILMDIQMPGMDGVKVTEEIRKTSRRDVPVIALTANAMKGDREKYIELGLNDYVSKPVKKRDLINTVIHWIMETRG